MGNVVWQLMCIIYAISALFMQGVFCIPSHCDINMVLIILQGGAEVENLTGEYEYLSDYGTGKLMIQKSSNGYDISDYESESSCRFLADLSNIETIENNRIYIKYPEPVFSADKVIFSYYVLEYNSYDVSKPALEIKKNDNETYQIQIDFSGSGIFMIVRGKLRKKDWSLQLQVLVEMK